MSLFSFETSRPWIVGSTCSKCSSGTQLLCSAERTVLGVVKLGKVYDLEVRLQRARAQIAAHSSSAGRLRRLAAEAKRGTSASPETR